MNKRDLIDAISGRLGDKKSATEAVNAVLETIQSAVANGDKVAITGFGVFEKSERPARTARNPATASHHRGARDLGAEVPSGCRLQGPRQRREAGRQEVTHGAGGIRGRYPDAARRRWCRWVRWYGSGPWCARPRSARPASSRGISRANTGNLHAAGDNGTDEEPTAWR